MPKLVAIAGPLCGGVFPLSWEEGGAFSIGRSVDNTLCVEDPSVSRHHCVVTRRERQFTITDRGSVNRTYINGLPVEAQEVRNGDEIKIGESLFLFVTEGDSAEEGIVPQKPIHLDKTLMLAQAAEPAERFPVSPATARYLEALLAVGDALPTAKGLEALANRILEAFGRAFEAERGVLVLAGTDPATACGWGGEPEVPPAALLERMAREPVPLVWNRKAGQSAPPDLEIDARAGWLAAVPLVAYGRLVGALGLTGANGRAPLADIHLAFLKKTAGIAAAVLDGAVNIQNQEAEARLRRAQSNLEHNMVGESAAMRKVYETIARVAPTDSTVLIRGESGTGKELAARAVHRNSLRARKPFVAINCAALTETLLESELFGHEKGAFTGAAAQKKGKLEEAGGGTVFFDEIGEMSSLLQAKLLRFLQEREFERVGGTRPIKADVRVIAATNRDLEDAIRGGTFRSDLYYRLNVVTLAIPPLREHPEDVEPLANHFARKHSRKLNKWIAGISRPALADLKSYDWPGNVRELENVFVRALVLGSRGTIQPEDLPDTVIEASQPAGAATGAFHATIKEAKRRLILETLQRTGGNYLEAAKVLELHPNSLHRMIRTFNLKVKPTAG